MLCADGMQASYLVLSDEERAKGFVRPVRRSYRHAGRPGPTHPLRDLTTEEVTRYASFGYVKFEPYPGDDIRLGRYWKHVPARRCREGLRHRHHHGRCDRRDLRPRARLLRRHLLRRMQHPPPCRP